ncbi:hypothetical protein DXG01_013750 [Tephrocybe rancida]|nr:hypothetical protein DXG01_013750 [Tephrocybe rancida]
MRLWLTLFLVTAIPTVFPAVTVQKPGLKLPPSARTNRDTVEKIFIQSYNAYKTFAWGHDDLTPESQSFYDGRNGWGEPDKLAWANTMDAQWVLGASIVDALTTLHIMGQMELFHEAVNFSSQIDFSDSHTPDTVSVFETTIRFLGGLLSAYELSDEKYPALLQKAKEIGDKMAYAWVANNSIPFGFLNFTTNEPIKDTSNIAEAGTLVLEWGTLSKYTKNDTYRQLAEGSFRHISTLASPFPGMVFQGIDPADGQSVGGYISWGGGCDSYYEYLIKYARLTNTDDPLFVNTWETAIDSSIHSLISIDFQTLTGGKLLNNQTIINYALDLIDGCWNTRHIRTGIGPEGFAYIASDGNYTGFDPPTEADLAFYDEHGFYVWSSDYILRPEVLESNFYAWRITGNTKYLDRATSAIASFRKYLPATVGFTGIEDVNDPASAKIDDMESFWFAEVLKYL